MSDPVIANYHFLAWCRRGVATAIAQPDEGVLPDRATLSVQVSVSSQQGAAVTVSQPAAKTVQISGPGDATGIIVQHVIRTEPRNLTVNFEPNYLCGIEFDSPDLPWLLTPAAPGGDRLRPWVALIVLKPDEWKPVTPPPGVLPAIEVSSVAALPDLSDSWNWAHTQVSGDAALADAMAAAPGTVISRLLCPRRLDPETSYTAFLVPAFDNGRQNGLGQDVSAVTQSQPAWTAATPAPLLLPCYYSFAFTTSDAGDFESLVRALTPRALGDGVGSRAMDVSHPEAGIPSAGPPLGLEGALRSAATNATKWLDPAKTDFQTAVQTFVNVPSAMTDDPAHPLPDDPIIAPPIYGRWHAAVQSVDRTAPGWVNDLNLDPRNRAGGGMGTQVVQGELTQLMASAWQQVDGVLAANQKLRQAQLARAALKQLHTQHLGAAQADTAFLLTAPLHARLLASPATILATVRASRVPERLLSPAFRRATRPRRRIAAAGGPPAIQRPSLLSRVNSGEIAVVPPPKPPDGMVSIDQVTDQVANPADQQTAKNWRLLLLLLIVLIGAALVLAVLASIALGPAAAVAVALLGGAAANALYKNARAALARAAAGNELHVAAFTPQAVAAVPPQPGFQILAAGAAPAAGAPPAGGTADSAAAAKFRSATSDLFTYLGRLPADPPPAPALDLAALRTTLMTRLDPAVTVPRRVNSRIKLGPRFSWAPADPIEPIMAAPEFDQPMYQPLRDLSEQYVLPGVDLISPNTVGLVLANHAFIEAYMVGLNHEMARQLLWNGYPTDQRGSCFRQFWDVSAYVPQKGDPTDPAALAELVKDIPPIHTWPLPVPLGQHPNRTDIALDNVVLLVRGELFKRYPNAIVYAAKAKRTASGLDIDETDERYPIFGGQLSTDITFLGFNLGQSDARGGTAAAPDGFFFVFQEQPSEPRFGLEPTERTNPTQEWADLAWTNFGAGPPGGGIFQLPDLGRTTRALTLKSSPWRLASRAFSLMLAGTGATVPDMLRPSLQPSRVAIAIGTGNPNDGANKWGVNSAQTAYILLRLPFRILIHADSMLPPAQ